MPNPNPYISPQFKQHIDIDTVEIIFEIGMGNGLFTQQLLNVYNKCKHIHSFECNPDAFEQCRQNVASIPNITYNELALAEFEGEIPFYKAGLSSSRFVNKNLHAIEGIYIPCTTLNKYCEEHEVDRIDLICMDTDGSEFEVLMGGTDMLFNIKWIIMEVQNFKDGLSINAKTRSDIADLLKQYGFEETFYEQGAGPAFGNALFTRLDDVL